MAKNPPPVATREDPIIILSDDEGDGGPTGLPEGPDALDQQTFGLQLLDIYPDMEPAYIQRLWAARSQTEPPNLRWLGDVITSFAERGNYPRKDKKRKWDETEDEDPEQGIRNFEQPEYPYIAQGILANEFRRLSVAYIRKVMDEEQSIFKAYLRLEETARDPALATSAKISRPRKLSRNNPRMQSDVEQAKMDRELQDAKAVVAARIEEERLIAEGQGTECGCCYGDIALIRAVACPVNHLFCKDCVVQLASTEIGKGLHRLQCMHSSGCTETFEMSTLREILDKKAIMAIERRQRDADIKAAGIEGLWDCPFCDYKEIVAPVEEDHEFRCRNPACLIVSCRRCNKKTHIPLSCEEYRDSVRTTARHTVEEAMTSALVRACNKCAYKFYKEEGCNKITCTVCRNSQCYICGENVTDYNHFRSDRPGLQDNRKCPLTDDTLDRHRRDVEAAGRIAREKVKQAHNGLAEEDINVTGSPDETAIQEANRHAPEQKRPRHPVFRFSRVHREFLESREQLRNEALALGLQYIELVRPFVVQSRPKPQTFSPLQKSLDALRRQLDGDDWPDKPRNALERTREMLEEDAVYGEGIAKLEELRGMLLAIQVDLDASREEVRDQLANAPADANRNPPPLAGPNMPPAPLQPYDPVIEGMLQFRGHVPPQLPPAYFPMRGNHPPRAPPPNNPQEQIQQLYEAEVQRLRAVQLMQAAQRFRAAQRGEAVQQQFPYFPHLPYQPQPPNNLPPPLLRPVDPQGFFPNGPNVPLPGGQGPNVGRVPLDAPQPHAFRANGHDFDAFYPPNPVGNQVEPPAGQYRGRRAARRIDGQFRRLMGFGGLADRQGVNINDQNTVPEAAYGEGLQDDGM